MRSMRFKPLIMCLLVVAFTCPAFAQAKFEDSPKYQIVPGKSIGEVHLGMTMQQARVALSHYGPVAYHENPGKDYRELCVMPIEQFCVYATDGKVIDAMQSYNDSRFWIAQTNGESLHLLSAGASHFTQSFGNPSCEKATISEGVKIMMMGWESAGLAGAFLADTNNFMVAAVYISAPGEVCN